MRPALSTIALGLLFLVVTVWAYDPFDDISVTPPTFTIHDVGAGYTLIESRRRRIYFRREQVRGFEVHPPDSEFNAHSHAKIYFQIGAVEKRLDVPTQELVDEVVRHILGKVKK